MLAPIQNFCGGASMDTSKDVDAQRCINLYPEVTGVGAKAPVVLRHTPGMLFYTNGTTYTGNPNLTVQGGIYVSSSGKMYATSNNVIFEIVSGVSTYRGSSSNTAMNPVVFADNGTIMINVYGYGGYTYYITMSTGAQGLINDAVLQASAPTHVAYMDGFFIVNDTGTNVFRVSPLSWNGIDAWDSAAYDSADQSPDNIEGLIVSGRDLWIFGSQSYEIWYDAGLSPFPFARNISVSNQIGTSAKYSIAQIQGSVFWLGGGVEGSGKVYMSRGFEAIKISNSSLEQSIQKYTTVSDAFGLVWQEGAHTFYALTFITENVTWVYDVSTGAWHQRLYLNPVSGKLERWRAIGVVSQNNKTYVMDRLEWFYVDPPAIYRYEEYVVAKIYELSPTTYTDGGDPIRRIRSSPHSYQELRRVFYSMFQVDMEVGVGLSTGQGNDPIIFLRISKDGGHTWGNPRIGRMGRIGKYLTLVMWNRLGNARDMVFEISISDPVPVTIMGAMVEAEAGEN